jgi:hypothetical protein
LVLAELICVYAGELTTIHCTIVNVKWFRQCAGVKVALSALGSMAGNAANLAAIHEAYDQRTAGNHLIDRYLKHLECMRGDALASYEAVRLYDEMTEDLTTRAADFYASVVSSSSRATISAAPTDSKGKIKMGISKEHSEMELVATEGMIMEIADAKVSVLDHCYEAVRRRFLVLSRQAS